MSAHHLERGQGGEGSTADIIVLAERMSVRIISRAGDKKFDALTSLSP